MAKLPPRKRPPAIRPLKKRRLGTAPDVVQGTHPPKRGLMEKFCNAQGTSLAKLPPWLVEKANEKPLSAWKERVLYYLKHGE